MVAGSTHTARGTPRDASDGRPGSMSDVGAPDDNSWGPNRALLKARPGPARISAIEFRRANRKSENLDERAQKTETLEMRLMIPCLGMMTPFWREGTLA